MKMYQSLHGNDVSEKKSTSCVILAIVMACLTFMGILLAIGILERPSAATENELPLLPLEPCAGDFSVDSCSMALVESIPLYMDYQGNATFGVPLETVWKGLISMATQQLDVVSFYWTLTGDDIHVNSSSAIPGRDILAGLEALPSKNISVRVLTSIPSVNTTTTDFKDLQHEGLFLSLCVALSLVLTLYIQFSSFAGVQVREVDFGRLTNGVLHSKFWIVDRRHVFIGSANMDWRALTQVKELGVVIYNCSSLALDLEKIFSSYWEMGLPNSTLPDPWPSQYDTNITKDRPLLVTEGDVSSQIYIAGSPPQFCPRSRTQDIDAILSIISEAGHYVDVAIMEYFPMIRFGHPKKYWAVLDDAIRAAAFERGVKIRMLVSCGRDSTPDMMVYLRSLAALDSRHEHINIKIKLFIVPVGNQTDIPFSRVNHNKYMMTDKVAYVGTSNWCGDYFTTTGGVGLVISQHAPHSIWNKTLQSQLKSVFERDWHSEFAVYLDELGHHPDCALVT